MFKYFRGNTQEGNITLRYLQIIKTWKWYKKMLSKLVISPGGALDSDWVVWVRFLTGAFLLCCWRLHTNDLSVAWSTNTTNQSQRTDDGGWSRAAVREVIKTELSLRNGTRVFFFPQLKQSFLGRFWYLSRTFWNKFDEEPHSYFV